ncbi:MAG: hypothetical protein ABMB14_23790, partial [Myxococcota bacterium]
RRADEDGRWPDAMEFEARAMEVATHGDYWWLGGQTAAQVGLVERADELFGLAEAFYAERVSPAMYHRGRLARARLLVEGGETAAGLARLREIVPPLLERASVEFVGFTPDWVAQAPMAIAAAEEDRGDLSAARSALARGAAPTYPATVRYRWHLSALIHARAGDAAAARDSLALADAAGPVPLPGEVRGLAMEAVIRAHLGDMPEAQAALHAAIGRSAALLLTPRAPIARWIERARATLRARPDR